MKCEALKKETHLLLQQPSPDSVRERSMYHIYVVEKIDAGLRDSAAGRVFTSEQIRASLKFGR